MRTVLIVEDSTEDRETYRRYLRKAKQYNYQIWETASGEEGLQLCLTTKPDLILLDYLLPDLDGLEFLAELKITNKETDLPVIMLTGQGNESVAVAAMKNGAEDYLIKGQITPESLHNTIESVLQKKNLQRQLAQSQERQKLTAAICLQIQKLLKLEDILETVVTQVQQLLKCDRVIVYQLFSELSGKIVAESVTKGWISILNTQILDTCFTSSSRDDYRQGKKRAITNIYEAGLSDCHIQLLEQYQIKANLVVPILLIQENPKPGAIEELSSPRDIQLWGLLIAHQCFDFRQWQNEELNLLDELAVQIAIAIQQAELFQQLQQEIEQRKESEIKLRAMFNQTFQFISLLEPDGTIIEMNQTALSFGRVSLSDCLGKFLWETPWWKNFPENQEQLKEAISQVANGSFVRYEVDVQGVNQEVITLDFSLKPIKDETNSAIMLIAEGRDISERKIAEKNIKIANAELARSNQELQQFAYIASHDLQEPLRKIKSFAELLALDYQGKLDETADKYINYITDGVSRMQALISDLLAYSRVSQIKLTKQPTDLNLVLEQVKNDLSVAIAETKAIITATPLPTVQANLVQMGQLFQNLIANSIKFRGENIPKIHVSAQLQQEKWLISVQDNGIGIKPEYSERIFVIFQRLHNRSKYPGTGIGLAICRKIVDRYGGEIWLESEIGKGTIFYFTFPI